MWENLLELLFVLCVCHVFSNVIVKILCVLFDCMCVLFDCMCVSDTCAKLVKRKRSSSTRPFPTAICSHFLDFS